MKHKITIEDRIIDGEWQPSRTMMAKGWFEIQEIDHVSFSGCQVHPIPLEVGEVREVKLEDIDYARTDAGQYGVLTHSPYCPFCGDDGKVILE